MDFVDDYEFFRLWLIDVLIWGGVEKGVRRGDVRILGRLDFEDERWFGDWYK